jgi:hypothetical protein
MAIHVLVIPSIITWRPFLEIQPGWLAIMLNTFFMGRVCLPHDTLSWVADM